MEQITGSVGFSPLFVDRVALFRERLKSRVEQALATALGGGGEIAEALGRPLCFNFEAWDPTIGVVADGRQVSYEYQEVGLLLQGTVTLEINAHT